MLTPIQISMAQLSLIYGTMAVFAFYLILGWLLAEDA